MTVAAYVFFQIVFIQDRNESYLNTAAAKSIKVVVEDSNFWTEAKHLFELLKPYSVITGMTNELTMLH